ncbi:MAG: hypothetical protein IPH84_06090 [Bacteroidales bacterium]|nr:hypothetical protein [Bacteroidales bacterium]
MKLKLKYSGRLQSHILMIWAVAVFWIHIGNIINFHQHHIWGKQLIPAVCSSNRQKEKAFDHSSGYLKHINHDGNLIQGILPCDDSLGYLYFSSSVLGQSEFSEPLANNSNQSHSLRGPPQA